MDSTESFNVSVTENFSFWSLGSVYLNTGPAAAVCFAFLPTNPSRLFGSWSLCCIITSFTCSSCYAFLQESLLYLVLMSNEPIKLYFSLETAHSCFGKHWNVAVASSSLCTIATVTLLQEDVPWWAFGCQQPRELLQNRQLNKTAPKIPGTGMGIQLHLGWGCLWGEGLSFKMWDLQVLSYWVFSVTWENLLLITVCRILFAGEPRSACCFKDNETINVPVSNSDL